MDETRLARPLPLITQANRYFWCGGADGQLHILRCGGCQLWIHPFAGRCPRCSSDAIAPQPVSGRATVVGFSVNHQQWQPDIPTPYVVAVVELEEQSDIRLMTNLPRTPIDEVRAGLPVKVYFERYDDVWLPLFEAA